MCVSPALATIADPAGALSSKAVATVTPASINPVVQPFTGLSGTAKFVKDNQVQAAQAPTQSLLAPQEQNTLLAKPKTKNISDV